MDPDCVRQNTASAKIADREGNIDRSCRGHNMQSALGNLKIARYMSENPLKHVAKKVRYNVKKGPLTNT